MILGASCLLLVVCFAWALEPPNEETRFKKYSSLLAEWQKRGLAEHFPKVISAEASAKKLSAFPGFLQGGGWFQVRLTLPPAMVAGIFKDATKQAKAFYDGGDAFKLVEEQKDGLPGTSFHTANNKGQDFPPDYRIFIFHARASRPGEDFQWNHGDSRGVVISRTRNEVIYFAEDW